MEISVPKTECMMLRQYKEECKQQPVCEEEYTEKKLKHVCEWCRMDYPSKDSLSTHVHYVHYMCMCIARCGTAREKRSTRWIMEKVLD